MHDGIVVGAAVTEFQGANASPTYVLAYLIKRGRGR
jgi:hypothetical protein